MSFSLIATAFGGLYLATIPDSSRLYYLFGYWGCTSVLLFWSAMIKETRIIAGEKTQGIAFGLLDGGRGLVASIVASLAVLILANYMHLSDTNLSLKVEAMQAVVIFYTVMTCLAAIFIWKFLPEQNDTNHSVAITSKKNFQIVIKDKNVWLQGGIIICAYCGFKSLDNYGLYATQVLKMTQVDAASLTAFASYSRPVAAIIAGLIADRWHTGKGVILFFALTACAFIGMAIFDYERVVILTIVTNLVITYVSVYALRGIYFALIEQTKISLHATGAAVGLISLIGYTPDIFFASITGRILDANPGFVGFQNYFLLIACISIVGIVLVSWLNRSTRNQFKIDAELA